ncbi:MAG: hypothetical protein ABL971_15485 [Vicinamibacterales bacterium]
MNAITTSTGATIALDGDLLAVLEGLYQEVVARSELTHTYEDMVKEVTHLVTQMTDDERRAYLVESLFLNTVRYENDKLAAIIRRLNAPAG